MSRIAKTAERIRLRPVERGDLPRMFELQLDAESNHMALTIPRNREAFDSNWASSLDDPRVVARAIVVDEVMIGYISCFQVDGHDHVGYWIDREFWGLGITSRALELLLQEVVRRPLTAIVATSNAASLRVLQKSGFVVEQFRHSPATDRFLECEEAVLVLR